MESYSRQNAQSHEVKAILCIGVVIVVLAMVNGALSKPPPARPAATYGKEQFPNYLNDPDAGAARVKEIVQKARGNFDRLTVNEQRWLDSVSAGHGERMVVQKWKDLQAEQSRKAKASVRAPSKHTQTEGKEK